jgi:hypothetical protein
MKLYKKTFKITIVCEAENYSEANNIFNETLDKVDGLEFSPISSTILIDQKIRIPGRWGNAFPFVSKEREDEPTIKKCKDYFDEN